MTTYQLVQEMFSSLENGSMSQYVYVIFFLRKSHALMQYEFGATVMKTPYMIPSYPIDPTLHGLDSRTTVNILGRQFCLVTK